MKEQNKGLINGHTTGGQQGTSHLCIIVSSIKYPAPIYLPMGCYPRRRSCTQVTLLYEWSRSLQRRLATCSDWSATFDSLYEVHKYCKLSAEAVRQSRDGWLDSCNRIGRPDRYVSK